MNQFPNFCPKKGDAECQYRDKKYKACPEHGIEVQEPLEYLGLICGQNIYVDLTGLNEDEKTAKKKLISDLLLNHFSNASKAAEIVRE